MRGAIAIVFYHDIAAACYHALDSALYAYAPRLIYDASARAMALRCHIHAATIIPLRAHLFDAYAFSRAAAVVHADDIRYAASTFVLATTLP